MSDFSAKIQAILDTSNIPKDISKIEKTPIKFNNVSLDTNNLINQIQTALNNHSFTINFNGANLTNQMQQMGASAGNTFSNAMNSRVKIKPFDLTTAVRNTSSAVSKLRQEFSNLNVPTDAINNVLDNLTKLDLSITKITHSVGKNSIKLNISGIDEFGKAISLTETFSQKTGKLTNFNKTVTQSFKEKQQAVNSSNQAMKTSNKELEEAIKLQKQMFSERSIKYDNGAYLYDSNDNINSDLVRKASASFSDLEQRYNQLRNSLSDEQKVRVDSSEVELAFNRMKELQTLYANINDKATRLIDSDNIESTDAYLQLAKRYKGEYTELFGKFKDNLNTTQLHELENLANSTTSKFQLLTASYEDLRERMSTKIESNFDKMDADLSKLESDMRKIDNVSQSTKNSVNGLRTSLDNLKNTTDVSDRISQFDTYTEAFAKQRAEVTKLKIAQSDEKNVLNQIAHTIDEITRKKIDLINSADVNESKILSQQIKDLESRLNSLKQNNKNILTAEDKAAIKELENLQKINIQQVQNKFSSPLAVDKLEADILKAKNSFQKLADAPTEVRGKLEALNRAFNSLGTATGTEQKIESFKKCQKALEEFTVSVNKAKAAEEQLKLTSQIKTELDDGTLQSKISQVTAEYQRLGETGHAKLSEIHKDIEKLEGLQEKLTQLKSDPSKVDELAKKYKEFGSTLKTVQNNLKIVSSETKNVVSNLKLDTFDNNMVAWLEKNSKAAGQFGSSIADLRERLAQLKASGNATVPQFRQLQEEFRNIQSAARAAGLTGRDTASLFKESLSILTRYFSATTLIFRAISGFKQMCQTVVGVNTAMTGLYRITNLSAQQYEVLYDKMITSAKEYGATLTDIINSTSSWIRLGFNENVAERLSEITAMYMHVTDLDYDTAVKNLVTAYKGFSDQLLGMFDNDTAKSVEYVADIFDKLGNEMPVSAAQVGEGLTRCASVMQQAGATIEEASAMVTGGGAITQDFATMGSALKIASLRIRSMKGELQALGEEVDENIESVSKVQTQILNLTHGKVNIFEEDGETFRDIFEVFRDIANIMPELKETEQADLLEIVAGKNRSNSIQSMLSNWDEVETALQKATEAQGTAAVENDKYMKSAQGHIDALKAAWQAFSATFVKSDFLTNSLTVLTKFVDVLDVLVDKLGTVPTVLGAIAAYASTKGVGELINQFRLLITLSDEYAHEVFN